RAARRQVVAGFGAGVGHAVLREVVGAPALAAVPRADLRAAAAVLRLLAGALLALQQPRAQHAQRLGLVLVLARLVLALHDGAGREVRDAGRGGRLGDLLAARAPRAA